ncbi:hypothetical protein GCM10007907_27960 [Chitinimonas prasina]|uniref:Uncharacterized protein n=1 Tax=Chitinimonas prasina TaxID=1434937 RepID=A0ABQ5YHE8_9NEIS|nr:hypothetical protein [Chitinimonas prasina]GLR14006.1 hypothetical protein GCM10007907_27960 [Chitinimonas prasina]
MDDFWGSVGTFFGDSFDGASDWVSGLFDDSTDWVSGLFGGEGGTAGQSSWGFSSDPDARNAEINTSANTRLLRQGGAGYENSASYSVDPLNELAQYLPGITDGAIWNGADLMGGGGGRAGPGPAVGAAIGGKGGGSGLVSGLMNGDPRLTGLVSTVINGALAGRRGSKEADKRLQAEERLIDKRVAAEAAASDEAHKRLLQMKAVPSVANTPHASAATFGVRFGG